MKQDSAGNKSRRGGLRQATVVAAALLVGALAGLLPAIRARLSPTRALWSI